MFAITGKHHYARLAAYFVPRMEQDVSMREQLQEFNGVDYRNPSRQQPGHLLSFDETIEEANRVAKATDTGPLDRDRWVARIAHLDAEREAIEALISDVLGDHSASDTPASRHGQTESILIVAGAVRSEIANPGSSGIFRNSPAVDDILISKLHKSTDLALSRMCMLLQDADAKVPGIGKTV